MQRVQTNNPSPPPNGHNNTNFLRGIESRLSAGASAPKDDNSPLFAERSEAPRSATRSGASIDITIYPPLVSIHNPRHYQWCNGNTCVRVSGFRHLSRHREYATSRISGIVQRVNRHHPVREQDGHTL